MARSIKIVIAAGFLFANIAQIGQNAHADDLQAAQIFINQMARQALAILKKPDASIDKQQAQFRNLLTQGLDIDHVARFVLGPYRRKASAEQIERFSSVLEDYIVLTYIFRFKKFQITDLIVGAAKPAKHNSIVVSSLVDLPDNMPDVHIDWRTHKVNGQWKIIDISIEGLSMAAIQREQYIAMIRQGGGKIDYLIDAMKAKNKALAKRAI